MILSEISNGTDGLAENRLLLPQGEVVPIEGNVQFADRHLRRFNLLDPPYQPMGQVHPPGSNPHQRQILYTLIPFENFMGDTGDRASDVSRVHYEPLLSVDRLWVITIISLQLSAA